ncbi:MAG: HyaD/HybD family hydrogenase maturation endopeptidase [Desulfobacterales bacterium]|jgi:hydrogenase maturation protease|nr:HyaD/HybD family hydrogenase maturation endopeptidase [Desulfobacterales bacterium]
MINKPVVTILGVGNLLYTDEGFGIHVVQRLEARYLFPEAVSVVDGGVLGINLLGIMSQPEHLIVVDIIRNGQSPGTFYRLAGADIPRRIRMKNSLHQVDLLEALTLCEALDHVPKTVIVGVEPEDMQTLGITLTATLQQQVDPVVDRVLAELDLLNVTYEKRTDARCA